MKKLFLVFNALLFIVCSVGYAQKINKLKAEIISSELIVASPEFASCHASSLVELPGKKLMVTFFAGPHESHPQVSIWMTTRENGVWKKPFIIADGIINDSLRFACWNPVLFRTRAGRLFLFYKVGRSPREWWGMMKYSDDDGGQWSAEERLPGAMLGPIKNKPMQLPDGTLVHPSSTESMDEKLWQVHIEKSDSNGRNWRWISVNNDSFGAIQPSLLKHKNNMLQMVCRSRQHCIVQSWSADQGETWSPLTKTELPNPNSGSDAITLQNGLQLLVYNPLEAGREWYNGRNKLSVAISSDGKRWRDIYKLEDKEKGEYSYPAVIQSDNGDVHISYTYERKNVKHVVIRVR